MSVASKKRFVTNKLESEFYELVDNVDRVAVVVAARGNNLHEVEDEDGGTYLASMPLKFRKTAWIRRGHFVVVRPIEEGDKVRAEIEHVFDQENVRYLRERGKWPVRFEEAAARADPRAIISEEERKRANPIDDDMLPPSDGDEEEPDEDEDASEESDSKEGLESEDADSESEEEPAIPTYNPNRACAPTTK